MGIRFALLVRVTGKVASWLGVFLSFPVLHHYTVFISFLGAAFKKEVLIRKRRAGKGYFRNCSLRASSPGRCGGETKNEPAAARAPLG